MENGNLTAERLRFLLDYCPESGVFVWKNPQGNRVKAGQIAGTLHHTGYVHIRVDGKEYRAHRLAFLFMSGHWPENDVDHANRIRSDNRLQNLRTVTHQQNMMNRLSASNTSGKKGVRWNKAAKKWESAIKVNGVSYALGYYVDIEDAATAYKNIALILHGDHNYFGEQQ